MAFCLVGAGLVACCLPVTAEVLARMYSGSENPGTPFSHEELVDAAVTTRDYTVGSHDLESLYEMFWRINGDGVDEAATATDETEMADGDMESQNSDVSPTPPSLTELQKLFDGVSDTRILSPEAISHLDDVNLVVQRAFAGLLLGLALLIICIVYLAVRKGKRWVGGVLIAGGILVLVLFAALGFWAVLNFDGFFAALHGVFFSQGNWTFPADSLLITIYPIPFWIGMGVVWLVVTVVLSLVSLVVGLRMRK